MNDKNNDADGFCCNVDDSNGFAENGFAKSVPLVSFVRGQSSEQDYRQGSGMVALEFCTQVVLFGRVGGRGKLARQFSRFC